MTTNNRLIAFAATTASLILFAPARAAAETPTFKMRVIGLFSPDRVADLRAIIKEWPDVAIVSIDFDHAEAVFSFEPAKLFADAKIKPDQIITRFDDKLRAASNYCMSVKPPSTTPRDQLKRIEIPAYGLDCKACCLAAYEIVAKIDGVEQATASFKEGRITALIDPQKTDKGKLEAALKQRGVALERPKK